MHRAVRPRAATGVTVLTRDPVATASIVERNAAPASTMQNALSINERRDGASTGVKPDSLRPVRERGAIGNLNITDHPNAVRA